MSDQVHDLIVTETSADGNGEAIAVSIPTESSLATYDNASSSQFMEKLQGTAIPGAEFYSSNRDTSAQPLSGTHSAILERCFNFIRNSTNEKRIYWVVGEAGVGKSTILQSVVESSELPVNYHASIFFSSDGRNDGTKTITTISYQFATKFESYRQLIEQDFARDPSLLQSSMTHQFNKLIVEPFTRNPPLKSTGRILIIIDGLDVCNDLNTQLELLSLIADSCITYPSSPLIWLISSRPETHIMTFFSRREVIPTYEKEEIPADSDKRSDSMGLRLPEEQVVWKLANAAGGLFAYAEMIIRYIRDPTITSPANPASQLTDVLHAIDQQPGTDVSGEDRLMALVDALYDRILSKSPRENVNNARKILLACSSTWDLALGNGPNGPEYAVFSAPAEGNFVVLCNWLGMTPSEAYTAFDQLPPVFNVPERDQAHKKKPQPLPQSFVGYISDLIRPKISPYTRQLMSQCAIRVLNEAPDGIDLGVDYEFHDGNLARGPSTGDGISLVWSADGDVGWNDEETRLSLYKLAMGEVVAGIRYRDPTFQKVFFIRLLTARFQWYHPYFPYSELRDLVFDKSRRSEFTTHGILMQIPLGDVEISNADEYRDIKLQFRCPAISVTNPSDPWVSSCQHKRRGEWEEGKAQDWITTFNLRNCNFCFQRFEDQFKNWEIHSPARTGLVMFTSTDLCCVEVQFVDAEDGMSEWTYWFWLTITQGERQKHGSVV